MSSGNWELTGGVSPYRSGTFRGKEYPRSSGVSPYRSGTFRGKEYPRSSGVSPYLKKRLVSDLWKK
ncbi:MAG: hypothetical protein HPY66_0523 [Firmicutes bacterium]|nr:hypothetical protein [Bacillota bacterium]